jgi:hypothetical protein
MTTSRLIHSSSIALACILPLALGACGSSANSPSTGQSASSGTGSKTAAATGAGTGSAAGTTTASNGGGSSTGIGSTGTTTTALGAAGDTVGGVVAATGTTVASAGTSLTNGTLNSPAGVTVLNNGTPGTGAGNVVDANVLSNPAPDSASVVANVLSNGQVVGVSAANPQMTNIQVGTALVNGVPTIVSALPGGAPLTGTLVTTTGQLGSAVTPVDAIATPLNPLLNVKLGTTQVIGSGTTPAAITANALTPTQLAIVNVAGPQTGAAPGLLDQGTQGLGQLKTVLPK